MIWITLGIIITSIIGFFLSRYIKTHKHSGDHAICPVGGKCSDLFQGRQAKFFGIPIENLGSAYFAIMAIIHTLELVIDIPNGLFFSGLILSVIAVCFSVYLTIVQVFVVKRWCTLALGISALNILVAILSFVGFEQFYIEFAYTYRDLLKWIYAGAIIMGTLMTTIHSTSFVRFLRDFEIDKREEHRLQMFSHTGWVIQGIALLSGLAIVFTDQWREYTDSTAFIVILIIMAMLVVYEVVLNMIISPRLTSMTFGESEELTDHKHSYYRKIAFAFVGIGLISWYSLLLLMVFDWFSYSSGQLFVGYGILLIISVVVTSFIENMLYKKSVYISEISEKIEQEKNEK